MVFSKAKHGEAPPESANEFECVAWKASLAQLVFVSMSACLLYTVLSRLR